MHIHQISKMSNRSNFLLLFLFGLFHNAIGDDLYYGTFPDGFIWSTATSAYQIEGAWNSDGKGMSIWDTFTHGGGTIEDRSNGDIACDSYHKYNEDIQLMKNLGVSEYRFSLSWSRILPNGTKDVVNQAGIDFYQRLLTALQAAGIEPMVTLYHWDLPQALQDIGGWENETLADIFNDYARICYQSFGTKVKKWLTFNEPYVFTWLGYGIGVHAPGLREPGTSPYKAAHTVIRAHGQAYRTYQNEFKPTQNGQVSITLDCDWKEPKDPNNPSDVAAAERALQFKLGWFAHPIFVNGDYPDVMKETVANKSSMQGLSESRLPTFTQAEKDMIKGAHDFFGFNHYTTQLISARTATLNPPNYESDQDILVERDPNWPSSGSSWLKVVPWGFRKLLVWIKDNYGNPPLYVTENGMSDRNSSMTDDHRIYYYKHYINEMLKAIKEDGCDVKGYTAWSLLDNFEWAQGYTERFGMHYVNFSDPNRPRSPKASANYYAQIIRDHGFPSASSRLQVEKYTLMLTASLTCVMAFKMKM